MILRASKENEKFKICTKDCYVVVNLLEGDLLKKYMYVAGKVMRYITIAVMMAKRIHLYPFRTQKLSSLTPKVLTVNRWEDR